MTGWSEGYVADIGYTYGYYTELNPLRTRLAMLNAGVAVPEIKTACELGFGQGVSVNVHAAASATTWAATDFNPSQANFAQELARASGSDVLLADQAFAEFCARDDLPNFDYIGLHGIWSWISDANRKVIADFVARKLNVGGILYISYNTLPGWSNFAPMRHLMVQHEQRMSASGSGIVSRIEGAIGFADKLLETNPGYLKANPAAKPRFEPLKTQNRHYLAHEYFNQDWHPMYFADMAKWLADAKMTFACSANYLDHINPINFTPEQAQLLADIPDRMLVETTRDFLVNQQFRKDYWVKGPITLPRMEQLAQIRAERVVLVNPRADVSMKANGPLGEVTMRDDVYGPVLDVLADHQVRTIGEIEAAVEPKGINLAQIIEVMLVMGSQGQITSAQSKEAAKACRKRAHDLNKTLIKRAYTSGDVAALASPVTGGGIALPRFAQLFVEAVEQGKKTAADLAQHVWAILAAQGQAIVKEGKALEGEAANVAELQGQADTFLKKQLPILKALEMVG
jgi:hypothetical protein